VIVFWVIGFNPEKLGKTRLRTSNLRVSRSILIATAPTFILRLFDVAVSPRALDATKNSINRVLIQLRMASDDAASMGKEDKGQGVLKR
jgi:hypothetical protein